MRKSGASQYLHKLNKNTYGDETVIKIQEIQTLLRFFNILINITKKQYLSINLDFYEDITKDLYELILSVDKYNLDYVDNRIEFIFENNLNNHINEFHILKNIITQYGQHLPKSLIKYFL